MMAQIQRKHLKVDVLGDIVEFKRYVCTVWTPRGVSLTFYVKYYSGSEGYVHASRSIHGKALSKVHLLKLHIKIWAAKGLLEDREWCNLRQKYRIGQERSLILRRDVNLL